jgi:DNA-directed RNA polymerase omega subunit
MAKSTAEDMEINSKYEMILLAALRARNLEFGAKPLINVKNKKVKHALLALMEIEAGKLDIAELRKAVANQGESSLKTTELIKENEQDQIKKDPHKKEKFPGKDDITEAISQDPGQAIYEDQEEIEE